MPNGNYTPAVLVDTSNLTRDEWLDWRRKGIGGSDAAAVIGVSPYSTARDLYYEKLNIVTAGDNEDNWVQKKIGHLLEDLVAEIFSKKTGFPVYQVKKMFYHPNHPYMLADVDYFVTLPENKTAILEIKTTNYNAKDNWWLDGKESVPVNYEIQGRHYMAVTNIDKVYFCCLYGNTENEVIIRSIERDLNYEELIIAFEEDFWVNNVLKKVPPPYSEDGDLVLESIKKHPGMSHAAIPESLLGIKISADVQRYLELQEEKKKVKSEENRIDSELKRIRGCILDVMGKNRNAGCTVGDTDYTVEYNSTFKPTIDKDNLFRLKEQYPNIYDKFVTLSETRRFYVKRSQNTAA